MNRNLPRRIASTSGTAFSSFSGYRSDPLRDNNVLPVAAVDYQSALHVHFSELDQYLAAHLATGSPKRISTTTRKLTRLSIRQIHELSTDVYDELRRKTDNAVPFLLPREEFHPKRNQARKKLGTLSINRFNDLASDVYHELACRYPDFKEDPSGTIATRSDYEDYPVSDFPNKFPLRTTSSDRSAKINHIGSKNRRSSEDRRHTHGRATPDDHAANRTSSHCRPSRDMIRRSDDCDGGDAPAVSDVDDTIIYLSAVTEVQHSTRYSLKSPTMSPKRKLEVMEEIDELAPCPQRRRRPNGHLKVEEERGSKSRVTACRDEECGMKEATLVTSIPVSGHCDRVLSIHDFDSDLRGARNSGDAKRYDDDDIVLLSFTKQGTHNAAECSDQSQLNISATGSMIAAGGLLMSTSHLTVSSDTPANVSENDEILVARNTLVGGGHILRFRFVKGLQRRMNLDSTPAFPFSQYRVDSKGGVQTGQAPRLTHAYFESKNERDATVRRVMERLDTLFHIDKEWYTEFLACRDSAAQLLLDFLQELLDYDTSFAPTDRHRLFKALTRLSRHSELYPTCFPLPALKHETLVSGGSFGDVYSGYLRDQHVAVKMMRVFGESDIAAVLKVFGREALIWRQLSHPNLLPFYGLYESHQRLCLVSPWMENGTIRSFLRRETHDTECLLSFILDIALGLEHLHAKGVVHGDLKGDNIFVTPLRRACIADFGLSSIVTSMSSVQFTHSSKGTQNGTARYQAPELHRSGGQNDRQSDIYSFACVVYELLTGTAPFPELRREVSVVLAVLDGRRPSRPPSCSGTRSLDGLWSLLQNCWHETPEARPTASQIVECLRGDDIGAIETQSDVEWDHALTSKFRRQLIDQLPLPSVIELERILIGTRTEFTEAE